MQIQKIHSGLSWRLDMARAVAALVVLFGHVRNDYFVAYGDLLPEFHNMINFLLFFITRLGHEAVMVFFVLSGFLVGGNALNEWINGSFDFSDYFVKRLVRMYMVLIPALLLGGGADLIRSHLVGEYVANLTLSAFLGNFFFLQTIFVPTLGGNPPLWSLANEFWYYLLWPLVLMVFTKGAIKRTISIVLLIMFCFIAPKIMKLFPLWIFGSLLRLLPEIKMTKKLLLPILGIFGVCATYACWAKNILGEYAIGIAFGGLIVSWMFMQLPERNISPVLWKWFATFSFSMYAIHYPIMKLLILLLNQYAQLGARNLNAGYLNWLSFSGIASILILCGWIFFQLFEKQTYLIRKRCRRMTGRLRTSQ